MRRLALRLSTTNTSIVRLQGLATLSKASIDFQKCMRGVGGQGCVSLSKSSPHVAHVVVDNPKARNAFTGKMLAQLGDAVTSLANDPEIAVCTLSGRNGFFCSGADLQLVTKLLDMPGPLASDKDDEISSTDANHGGLLMCSYMQEVNCLLALCFWPTHVNTSHSREANLSIEKMPFPHSGPSNLPQPAFRVR